MVGIDVQSVSEVESSLCAFGSRYVRRLFTPYETEHPLKGTSSIATSFACRFAAKEAVLKMLSPREIVPSWKDIEVSDSPAGRIGIVLFGRAAELTEERGVIEISVSVSHGGGVAVASALAHAAQRM